MILNLKSYIITNKMLKKFFFVLITDDNNGSQYPSVYAIIDYWDSLNRSYLEEQKQIQVEKHTE